jgi:transposase
LIAPGHLNPLDCIVQADDCRRIAGIASAVEHRIMLHHMADTWDRIARDIDSRLESAVTPKLFGWLRRAKSVYVAPPHRAFFRGLRRRTDVQSQTVS